MKEPLIHLLPLCGIWLIVLVCNLANIFVLHKPVYILATLPLLALSVWAAVKVLADKPAPKGGR